MITPAGSARDRCIGARPQDGTWTITLRRYVDGAEVASASAAAALGSDLTAPVVAGNDVQGARPLVGSLDQLAIEHTARSAAWIETQYLVDAWWYLSDPSVSTVGGGTNTGSSPTDQREVGSSSGGNLDLASVVGTTRTVDATSGSTIPAGTWVRVEIRTDENGVSSVWRNGVQIVAPTAHSASRSGGSAGLRAVDLSSGQGWYVDDVRLRRYVSDEPATRLSWLDRQ